MSATRLIPVICGPTAGGKSALALELCAVMRERGQCCEIVTADAFQVYRGMDIGTAKPTRAERERVVHHLVDIVDPRDAFTAAQWLDRARDTIEECERRGVQCVVVGGTHLYVKLLVEGMFEGPGADESIRAQLREMSKDQLRAELERIDPDAASRIHPHDLRRTVRAIEVFRLSGRRISQMQRQWRGEDRGRTASAPSRFFLVVLDWPTQAINRRINARVAQMIRDGLVEEVRGLWQRGELGPTAREAIGYNQLVEHLEGRSTLVEAVEKIKIETRRFAKNQRTWLRRLRTTPGSLVLCPPDSETAIRPELRKWVIEVLDHAARLPSAPPHHGG